MTIAENIKQLKKTIIAVGEHCQRDPNSIRILAVSKAHSAAAIREAFEAGISDFGENYYQEALIKINTLSPLPIHWHFIGTIQSNKIPGITKHFDWVHSVDREKIVSLLATHRSAASPPLNICIQVNLDKEPQKSGVNAKAVKYLAKYIQQFPTLRLRGLMTIPNPHHSPKKTLENFQDLAHLLQEINDTEFYTLDTLSMGMSDNFALAIQAGSTVIRIGRAIFGERKK